jgi:serine/threonine protein kinase
MIGQLLTGRYLILEQLGAGGFSETYLARDKYLPHHPLCVAKCLKLSSHNTLPLDTAQRLFHSEAQVLGELGQHHDQIPTLLAFSHDQESAYQIQQYIEGKSLGQWLQQGQSFNSATAIALLVDVLPVLQFVHTHQIVHRDIKPSNLIHSTRSNRITLIDFGAACRLTQTATGWQPDGEEADLAIGTPGYMPPEQQSGQVQFNSDLYALGVSIIFLLTGIHPRKLDHNPLTGELEWSSQIPQGAIHPGLAQVLGGMVRHRASDRYATVAAVMEALSAFVTLPGAPPVASPRPVGLPAHKPMRQRWSRLARRSLWVTSLIASLIGGSYYYAQSDSAQRWMARMQWLHPAPDLQAVAAIALPSAPVQVLFLPGDQHLLSAHVDRGVRFWSLPTGQLLKTWRHRTPVSVVGVSRDGEWLLTGDRDRTLNLWHLPTGVYQRQFDRPSAPPTAVAFSPDSRTIASGSEDGTVRLWQRQTGVRQQTLARYGAAITALSFGPTAKLLISANSQFELQIWNLQTHQLQRTFAGHTAPIRLIQMLDAETFVSVGDDRTLVWQLQREELIRTSPKQVSPVIAAVVRDRQVITLDQQGTLQTWNPDTGHTEIRVFPKFQPVQAALSATGHYAVAWTRDRQFTIWKRGIDR